MTNAERIRELDKLALDVVLSRQRSILVLYYSGGLGHMHSSDTKEAYKELRDGGYTKEKKLPKLDILIHTWGGDPTAGYQLAQMTRLFSDDVQFLVPRHAYSAGTLLTLAGDLVLLGDNAGLSPFDITVIETFEPPTRVTLANIDNFVEFVKKCRQDIEMMLQKMGSKNSTQIEADLLTEMVRQITALKLGGYFRERMLTARYAEVLLNDYMFKGQSNAKDKIKAVIEHLVLQSPSHEFIMDYNLCCQARLVVQEMKTELYDKADAVIKALDSLVEQNLICANLTDRYKTPFIRFYELPENKEEEHEPSVENIKEPKKSTRNPKKTPRNVSHEGEGI